MCDSSYKLGQNRRFYSMQPCCGSYQDLSDSKTHLFRAWSWCPLFSKRCLLANLDWHSLGSEGENISCHSDSSDHFDQRWWFISGGSQYFRFHSWGGGKTRTGQFSGMSSFAFSSFPSLNTYFWTRFSKRMNWRCCLVLVKSSRRRHVSKKVSLTHKMFALFIINVFDRLDSTSYWPPHQWPAFTEGCGWYCVQGT